MNVHEIRPGVVYRDENVTVTAFPVKHGTWKEAYGYKFETKDRKIVISGDTAPTDEVVKACNGCDVLLHEVYNPHGANSCRCTGGNISGTSTLLRRNWQTLRAGRIPSCWSCITRCWRDCRSRIWRGRSNEYSGKLGIGEGSGCVLRSEVRLQRSDCRSKSNLCCRKTKIAGCHPD